MLVLVLVLVLVFVLVLVLVLVLIFVLPPLKSDLICHTFMYSTLLNVYFA